MVSVPTRILVADDEPAVLQAYQKILSRAEEVDELDEDVEQLAAQLFGERTPTGRHIAGYDLVLCQTSEEAVAATQQSVDDAQPIAVAFIDVRMPPGPDGIWAAEQIRALDQNIEIVIVTAYSDVPADEIGKRVPPPNRLLFLRKPLHADEIRNLASSLASKWLAERKLRVTHSELKAKIAELRALNRDLRIQSEVRRRAENAMFKSESLYRTLAESARDYIVIIDLDERLEYVNPFCQNLVGRPNDAVIGASLSAIVPSSAMPLLRAELQRTFTTEEPSHFEHAIDFGDRVVWLDTQLIPIQRHSSQLDTVLWIARDITDRKIAEEERAELERQLFRSQKLEAIGRLAGGVAHDFNNMLTVILNYTRFITDALPPDDTTQEDLYEIQKAAERAAKLTNQLLAFSRRGATEPKLINMNTVIADTETMLRRLIGEDIDLYTRYTDDLFTVRVDPAQIEQALINLVVNARDAMPGGGRLLIETANERVDSHMARTNVDLSSGHYVTLTVSDTGLGMTPDVMEHLFEPFFSTKDRGKGTGLGLAMVYGIVKQAGGHILVSSEPGRGSVFRIFLPKAGESMDWPAVGSANGESQPGAEVVLVVEDEESVLRLTRRILESQGYRVLAARNGMEAEKLVRAHDGHIDMLLTDVVMPTVNGRELAERIQAGRPDIRVLFMSGHSESVIGEQGVIDPGVAFLQKPFSPRGLIKKVRDVLDSNTA